MLGVIYAMHRFDEKGDDDCIPAAQRTDRKRRGDGNMSTDVLHQVSVSKKKAYGSPVQPGVVDIHQASERMRILDFAADAFDHLRRERNHQIGFVSRFQVLHFGLGNNAVETLQEGFVTGISDGQGKGVPFLASGKLDGKAYQSLPRMGLQ